MIVTRTLEVLRQTLPFDPLTDEDLAVLRGVSQRLYPQSGEVICEPGQQLPGALVLLAGTLSEDWPEETLLHSDPGALLAPGMLLSERPNDHKITAETAAELLVLPRLAFEDLLSRRETVAQLLLERVAQILVRRVRNLNQTLTALLSAGQDRDA